MNSATQTYSLNRNQNTKLMTMRLGIVTHITQAASLVMLLFAILLHPLYGASTAKLQLETSTDLSTWNSVELSDSTITPDGQIELSGLPDTVFFRLQITDFSTGQPDPPVIQSLQTTLDNGNVQHSLSGINFSNKTQASPHIWDDLEDGICDNQAAIGTWSSTNSLVINTTQQRHAGSSFNAANNFKNEKHAYFTGGTPSRRWFVQYWFMLDDNFDWGTGTYGNPGARLSNVKFFRMWAPGAVDENFVTAIHTFVDTPNAIRTVEYIDGDGQSGYFWQNSTSYLAKQEWHLFQAEYYDSEIGENNGICRIYIDGTKILDDSTLITRQDYADLKRPYIVGFYNSWNDSETDDDDFYIDDVYIDNTWARIEIGNQPDYESCTIREIQIPQSWSDTEIVFNQELRSLEGVSPLYLFIINEQGAISTSYTLNP